MAQPQAVPAFQLDRSERRRIEERRRDEKDARIGYRLSALLWLADGRSADEVASLLGRSVRTIRSWIKLYKKRGLWASQL
jgi:transposase